MKNQFWCVEGDDLKRRIRVTPNSSSDLIEGTDQDADRLPYLRIRVRAVPDKGQANKAVALLAKTFDAPKSSIVLVKGNADRIKTLKIANGARLAQQLAKDFRGKE